MGAAVHAKSGLACNYWESHPGATFPYGDSESNANYCRLTTSEEGFQLFSEPWCYTEHGPEGCGIPYCSKYRNSEIKAQMKAFITTLDPCFTSLELQNRFLHLIF